MLCRQGFGLLKSMELTIKNKTGDLGSRKILEFLEFSHQNFKFMEQLEINIRENRPAVIYDEEQGSFNIPVNTFGIFKEFWNTLTAHIERINIEINHHVNIDIISRHKGPVNQYMEALNEVLTEFEYFSYKEDGERYYEFAKNEDFGDEIKLFTGIYFTRKRR